MKVEILNVGNEVLTGKVINTNASFLSEQLEKIGFDVVKVVTVGDDKYALSNEVKNFIESEFEILITTGGLGPTHDDFTKEVVFETLGCELIEYQEAVELLDKYFKGNYAKCNLKQALYPKNSHLLPNDLGTAMGVITEVGAKTVGLLVGPPFELQPMFNNYMKPYLEKKVSNHRLIKEYIVMGVGESQVEELLQEFYQEYCDIEIAPYASIGKVRYQITGSKNNRLRFEEANAKFKMILREYIITDKNEDIEVKVFQELVRLGYKISFCESCTGGMLASKMINCDGASKVIDCSFVTYSEEAKNKYLDVDLKTIEEYDVVSEQVVKQMALGLHKKTNCEVSVATTGYVGPTGGTKEAPVGTVWIGILVNDSLFTKKLFFATSRNVCREKTSMLVFYHIYNILRKIK